MAKMVSLTVIHNIVTFLCFFAMGFFVLVCVSSPVWDKISFLSASSNVCAWGNSTYHCSFYFGVFGYTGSSFDVGYNLPSDLPTSNNVSNATVHIFTSLLVLYPIAGFLSAFAFLSGVWSTGPHTVANALMSLFVVLAMLCALVAWPYTKIIFGLIRDSLRSANVDANLGNAIWFALVALILLVIAFITLTYFWIRLYCQRSRAPHREAAAIAAAAAERYSNYNNLELPVTTTRDSTDLMDGHGVPQQFLPADHVPEDIVQGMDRTFFMLT